MKQLLGLLLAIVPAFGIELLWDANTETNVGYKVYIGMASRSYRTNFTTTNTSFTIANTNLFSSTNYFSVTAFYLHDPSMESEYSDEVVWVATNRLSKVKNLRFAPKMNVQSAPTPTGPWGPEFELGAVEITGQARFFRLALAAPEPSLLMAPQKRLRFDGSKGAELLITPKRPRQLPPFPPG